MRDSTIRIPDSVVPMRAVLGELMKHPALSPVSHGPMVELPCCGSRIDFEAIDCSQDGPSRVFWPPRWTCLQCERTFTPNATGDGLEELPIEPVRAVA